MKRIECLRCIVLFLHTTSLSHNFWIWMALFSPNFYSSMTFHCYRFDVSIWDIHVYVRWLDAEKKNMHKEDNRMSLNSFCTQIWAPKIVVVKLQKARIFFAKQYKSLSVIAPFLFFKLSFQFSLTFYSKCVYRNKNSNRREQQMEILIVLLLYCKWMTHNLINFLLFIWQFKSN